MVYGIVSMLCFVLAGVCFGVYQCTTIMNTMKKWWTRQITIKEGVFYYWSSELFVCNKDRNWDGKASWWEMTFPNDGGHRIGVAMILLFSLGASVLVMPWLSAAQSLILGIVGPIGLWFLTSVGFTFTFDKYRK